MSSEESREPGRVREMFSGIASRYDLLNHLLSGNIDRRWRRKAVMALPESDSASVLDICGGTGDLSLELSRRGRAGLVVCADFAHPMLTIAARKFTADPAGSRCTVLEADGLRLPFRSGSFDAVTVAFGVRNFVDLVAGLGEMHRVLKPGGKAVILEFSRPTGPVMGRLYGLYLRRLLPLVGDGVSGRSGPYRYLARTIAGFPAPEELAGRVREAGFDSCEWRTLTGGIVAIHVANKVVPGFTLGTVPFIPRPS